MLALGLFSLTLEGFKSFSSRVHVEFQPQAGLNFLTGRNEVSPALGANGAGKSSLWDALFWCLYGVSALGDRASDLVTWGSKRPYVCVEFLYGDVDSRLVIERWGNPDRLQIDGEVAEQTRVADLIGLTAVQFGQAVIFGQRARMFYDLTIPERGALLNSVLNLSVWERASDEAHKAVFAAQIKLREIDRDISRIEGAFSALPDVNALRLEADRWDKDYDANIARQVDEIETDESHLSEAKKDYQWARDNYFKPDRTHLDDLLQKKHSHNAHCITLADKRLSIQREQGRFNKVGPTCPTCMQPIDKKHREQHEFAYEALLIDVELQITDARKTTTSFAADYDKENERFTTSQTRAENIIRSGEAAKVQVVELERRISHAEKTIDRMMQDRRNPHLTSIESALTKIKEYKDQHTLALGRSDACKGDLAVAEYWQTAFKRIRLSIIQRTLLHWQIETANAASMLGIGDWQIEYKTEAETKSGTIKHGVQIEVRAPGITKPCPLPSGGEGQRIRLAIEMGLASLVQRLAGVQFGFEVWDEPSDHLSDEGLEDLVEALRTRAHETGKAIWLTDHRVYGHVFDLTWTVVKSKLRGSYIETDKRSIT